MKKPLLERLGDFVLGRGFSIVLVLCLATIGISGYYLMQSFQPVPEQSAAGTPKVVLPDTSQTVPQEQKAPTPPVSQPKPVEKQEPPKPTPQIQTPEPQTVQRPVQPTAPVYSWPVEGEVIRPHAAETLAYDPTMGDWRTHAGVDISAAAGSPVSCISEGVVKSVYTDDLMGVTVVVDHQNGVVSTYSNLSADPAAAQGQEVERGTVLGTVGSTALAESALPAHLHLEMTRDGEQVDPAGFFEAS